MKPAGINWTLAVVSLLLWSSGASAAPTECHINLRGRTHAGDSIKLKKINLVTHCPVISALCMFEGRHYALGETWVDDTCMQCTCLHPVGVGCCEMAHRPVDFPAWCEVRVESVTCKVSLVQTADPRLPCFPDDLQDPSHGSLPLQQQLKE
ncbi:hypothetical protein NL108_003830 [Boleophthalmus pectinirostris]|nr:hypothetical protein NL108_003830 [Boleophthalmus pectinirostris]